MWRAKARWVMVVAAAAAMAIVCAACDDAETDFDPGAPARGPGEWVGNGDPLNGWDFAGGRDALPQALSVEALPDEGNPPDCKGACRAFCDAQALDNPINKGLCTSLWGVGLSPRPVSIHEACRRLFADTIGRFPTRAEVAGTCEGKPWGEVVAQLMATDEFVFVNQRRWADKLLYNNQITSLERIYDMDALVGKLYRGQLPYDQFAAVVSAHPVVTRRFSTAGDRAEFVFKLLMGRPPLGSERSDLAKLYTLWSNGYYDHPQLGMRLPDALITYRCLTDEGEVDAGECTSILYGYNELVLKPDIRATRSRDGVQVWSGLLTSEEWSMLQMPGRLITQDVTFWESAVDEVIDLYLGYDLGQLVPEARKELVDYFLRYGGDVRALHYAVLTSVAYLQSTAGVTDRTFRWTYGPLKQVDAEVWIDSLNRMTQNSMPTCDHRITRPRDLLNAGTVAAVAMLQASRWDLNEQGNNVRTRYLDLARNLGGCPENEIGGRFKTVSILTTATQLSFVADLCNPTLAGDRRSVPTDSLLPPQIPAAAAVNPQLAEQIVDHQIGLFFSRSPSQAERDEALANGKACQDARCNAEQFARPVCFALLSSAEMLFY
jgi:hypothetical protein